MFAEASRQLAEELERKAREAEEAKEKAKARRERVRVRDRCKGKFCANFEPGLGKSEAEADALMKQREAESGAKGTQSRILEQ